jgi:hypothetical protein
LKKELKPASSFCSAALIFFSAIRFSASSRMICQFCLQHASSGNSRTGMYGRARHPREQVHEDVDRGHERRMVEQLAAERQAHLAAEMNMQDGKDEKTDD